MPTALKIKKLDDKELLAVRRRLADEIAALEAVHEEALPS